MEKKQKNKKQNENKNKKNIVPLLCHVIFSYTDREKGKKKHHLSLKATVNAKPLKGE